MSCSLNSIHWVSINKGEYHDGYSGATRSFHYSSYRPDSGLGFWVKRLGLPET